VTELRSSTERAAVQPLGWQSVRLRYLGRLKGGAGFPDADQGVVGEEFPFFKVKHLEGADNDGCMRFSEHSVSRESAAQLGAFIFPAGTVVLAKVGAALLLNRFRYLGQPSCLDNNMLGLVLDQRVAVQRFVLHGLSLIDLGQVANPGAVPSVNAEQVGDQLVPLPPLPQQRAIADYLDRETARLDALVAAKERVLGLLAEKRRALITRAVTRGLDLHAPLRDSGIPWLGEIPAHWERAQLRRFTQFITSGSRGWAEHYSDSGSLFVRIGNLTRDSTRLDVTDVQYVDPPEGAEGERTRIQAGDLLFSITAYLGSIAVALPGIERAYVNQHIALVRLDRAKGLLPQFAGYASLSDIGQSQLVGQGYGGTKTQLALDDIRELWFPIPPTSEQRAIVSRIDRDTAYLDRLRSTTSRTIELLNERRAAIIAAAVTGQIDVENAP
jgi:type I restriction enzyme, S subunit